MAVTMKAGAEAFDLSGLMAFLDGFPPAQIEFVTSHDVKLKTFLSGIELHAPSGGVHIAFNASQAIALTKGKVDPEFVPMLRQAIAQALDYLMKTSNGETVDPATFSAASGPTFSGPTSSGKGTKQMGAMTLLQAKPPPVAASPPGGSGAWPCFDPKALKTATPIKLRDATRMYEPVKGSSPNSRYFLVAANQDLRIAARYKGTSLSVRIEGPDWTKHGACIQACGFDNVQLAQGYASLHLHVGDPVIASKALGAILLGLGIPLETPLPELKVIRNVGS